jgi:multicomponent Na+:H+ antiporter subunit D
MILSAAGLDGLLLTYLVLLFASAGVFHHSGIKIPYFAFFGHDSGKRCAEAPVNMLVAMAIAAALCIGLGVYPDPLYAMLPYPVDYAPYTGSHVLTQLQLLLFSALAFAVLMRTGIYPPELAATNLDFDWSYRRLLPRIVQAAAGAGARLDGAVSAPAWRAWRGLDAVVRRLHGPQGVLSRTRATGSMALGMMIMLLAFLAAYYLL